MELILLRIGLRRVLLSGILFGVFCSVELALVVPLAYAVVDQQYVPATANGNTNIGSGNVTDWAQTFTVGLTGMLTGVDLWVDRHEMVTQPLLFDIRRTDGGIPTEADSGENVLASASIPAAMFSFPGSAGAPPPNLPHIDLTSAPIPVVAGDVLAIVLRSDDPGIGDAVYNWHVNAPGAYVNGSAFIRFGAPSWGVFNDYDQVFRTYVNPVPEPSTWFLLITATLLFRGRRIH